MHYSEAIYRSGSWAILYWRGLGIALAAPLAWGVFFEPVLDVFVLAIKIYVLSASSNDMPPGYPAFPGNDFVYNKKTNVMRDDN